MAAHRPGVNPGFLTKHTLRLEHVNQANGSCLVNELDALSGVDGVWLNERKKTLKIAYDASRHNVDEVIGILRKHGATVSDSWWSRVKLGWQRQTDQNIRDNAAHVAHCCNKPPR